jgi:hypothetical protein
MHLTFKGYETLFEVSHIFGRGFLSRSAKSVIRSDHSNKLKRGKDIIQLQNVRFVYQREAFRKNESQIPRLNPVRYTMYSI